MTANVFLLCLATFASLFYFCDAQSTVCPSPETLQPCFCEALGGENTGTFAIICVDVHEDEVRKVFEFVNTTDFEDQVTHFVGQNIAFTDNALQGNFFHYLTRVRTISLTYSNIHRLGKEVFHSYTFYDEINLSNNNLTALPDKFFLTALRANLSHNLLTEIQGNSFYKFLSIDLNHNRLKRIHENAFNFEGYENAKLDFSHNSLTDGSFEQNFMPYHSVAIDVSNNNLTYFDESLFSGVQKIFAYDNPLQCDCRMKWIVVDKYFPFAGTCPDGKDFVRSYLDAEADGIRECAARQVVIEDGYSDKMLFAPCELSRDPVTQNWSLDCFPSVYERLVESLSSLRSRFTQPIRLHKLSIAVMSFEKGEDHRIAGDFISFLRLDVISITSSSLSSIAEDAFYLSARTATEIDLSSNKLKDGSGAFEFISKFINAKKISLAGNKLQTIPGGFLKRMRQLKQIDLSGNQLSVVSGGAFIFNYPPDQFRFLQIDLSKNRLTGDSFAKDFIEQKRYIVVNLILTLNELSCLNKRAFAPFFLAGSGRNKVDVDFKSDNGALLHLSGYCESVDE